MFEIYKKEVLFVDKLDWTHHKNGLYEKKYWGKIVCGEENNAAAYFTDDGKGAFMILAGFEHNGEKISARELLQLVNEGAYDKRTKESEEPEDSQEEHEPKEPSLNIEELVVLKAAGYSTDDICRMKKENVF
jgi:hypothetical protein